MMSIYLCCTSHGDKVKTIVYKRDNSTQKGRHFDIITLISSPTYFRTLCTSPTLVKRKKKCNANSSREETNRRAFSRSLFLLVFTQQCHHHGCICSVCLLSSSYMRAQRGRNVGQLSRSEARKHNVSSRSIFFSFIPVEDLGPTAEAESDCYIDGPCCFYTFCLVVYVNLIDLSAFVTEKFSRLLFISCIYFRAGNFRSRLVTPDVLNLRHFQGMSIKDISFSN